MFTESSSHGAKTSRESWTPPSGEGCRVEELGPTSPLQVIILEQGESRAFDTFDRFAQFAASEGRTLYSLLDDLPLNTYVCPSR